jgi:hypothetical protein
MPQQGPPQVYQQIPQQGPQQMPQQMPPLRILALLDLANVDPKGNVPWKYTLPKIMGSIPQNADVKIFATDSDRPDRYDLFKSLRELGVEVQLFRPELSTPDHPNGRESPHVDQTLMLRGFEFLESCRGRPVGSWYLKVVTGDGNMENALANNFGPILHFPNLVHDAAKAGCIVSQWGVEGTVSSWFGKPLALFPERVQLNFLDNTPLCRDHPNCKWEQCRYFHP